mmetsp:Transcript_114423/g.330603  ORF Transcript_114423/g.330603 Transcript_114423/m.330603 type:complete len:320 (+) Transcript_114423:52-1011(+)
MGALGRPPFRGRARATLMASFTWVTVCVAVYPPPRKSAMRVIGAGLPNTGTQSLVQALMDLGFEPVHGMDFWLNTTLRSLWDTFLDSGEAGPAIDGLLDAGFDANFDIPTVLAWKDMMDAFPNTKVLLTVRDDGEKWYQSFSKKMHRPDGVIEASMKWIAWYSELDYDGFFSFIAKCQEKIGCNFFLEQTPELHQRCVRGYDDHVALVKRTVPADRLLVYNVKEGWEPLCKFLGVPVPSHPFPKRDITKGFTKDIFKDMFDPKYQLQFKPMFVLLQLTILWCGCWCLLCRCVCRRCCSSAKAKSVATKDQKTPEEKKAD